MSAKTADTQQRSPRSTIFTWRTTTPTPRPFSSSTTRDISNSTILILQVCYSSAAHRTPVQRLVTTHGKDFNDQQWKLNLCRNITDSKISPYWSVSKQAQTIMRCDHKLLFQQFLLTNINFDDFTNISWNTHGHLWTIDQNKTLSRFV